MSVWTLFSDYISTRIHSFSPLRCLMTWRRRKNFDWLSTANDIVQDREKKRFKSLIKWKLKQSMILLLFFSFCFRRTIWHYSWLLLLLLLLSFFHDKKRNISTNENRLVGSFRPVSDENIIFSLFLSFLKRRRQASDDRHPMLNLLKDQTRK